MTGCTSAGQATRTSPAPERSAAAPTKAAAPAMPRPPATTSTVPYMPLLLSAGRFGSVGNAVIRSSVMRLSARDPIGSPDLRPSQAGLSRPPRDQSRDVSALEAGVDIDGDHVEAQLLSIPSSAASPPKLAPYPMLVGTAITGQSTSPPTTLGSAPSIPATTTIASAPPSAFDLLEQAMQPRDADVGQESDLAVPRLGRNPRLLGHGQVARPGRDHHHLAQLRTGVERSAEPESPAQRSSDCPSGKTRSRWAKVAGSTRVTRPPCSWRSSVSQDALDLLGRLPLTEDHLGKTAAETAMDVNVGVPHLLERLLAELQDRVRWRDPTRADSLEQLRQLM